MGQTRESLERQLKIATADLEKCVAALDEKGVAADKRKADSKWRSLDANCRQLKNRLSAVEAIAAREAECQQRKEAAAAE